MDTDQSEDSELLYAFGKHYDPKIMSNASLEEIGQQLGTRTVDVLEGALSTMDEGFDDKPVAEKILGWNFSFRANDNLIHSCRRDPSYVAAAHFIERLHSVSLETLKQFMKESNKLSMYLIALAKTIVIMGAPKDNLYILAFIHRDANRTHTFCTVLGLTLISIAGDIPLHKQMIDLIRDIVNAIQSYILLGQPLPIGFRGADGVTPLEMLIRDAILAKALPQLAYRLRRDLTQKESHPADRFALLKAVEILIDLFIRLKRANGEYQMRKIVEQFKRLNDSSLECARKECKERAIAVCERCQSFRYCSRKCQRADWKETHRVRCFKTNFRGLDPLAIGLQRDSPMKRAPIRSFTESMVAKSPGRNAGRY